MTPLYRPSTWLFLLVLVLCWLVIRLDVTPPAVDRHPADTTFNVPNAISHLREITREPHSLGTAANDTVGNFIVSACTAIGLDVTVTPFQIVLPEFYGVLAAGGTNIVATLPGSSSAGKKKILVMGHYDSEPNSLGAGDDGSACAAMLEAARALRAGAPLPVDVVFLFTDGEEDGLLGAEAFTEDPTRWKDIGLVLNFDGRGDRGRCMMFRTSKDNRWLIDEYARAPIHHLAGSLYSELFNLLPNNTDFTPFIKTGIPGFDFAYAEGFTAYHNKTDNVDNIEHGTIQEQGDDMLGTIRHFARLDLDNPTKPGGHPTYFNLIGEILIHYPPSVNFVLLLLVNALVLFALVSGIYKNQIRLSHAALGLLIFLVTLIVLYFLARWTLDAIRAVWPLYIGYYPNVYNGYYFYLALAAEALGVFSLLYLWPLRRRQMSSLFIAVLVIATILLDFAWCFIPAGTYFLCFPLLGGAAAFPYLDKSLVARMLSALFPILFLAPLVYSLAEIFDVQPQAALIAPITGIFLGLLIPIFSSAIRESRWLIPGAAGIVLLASVVLGALHSSYSPQKPLKTDLHYVVRSDEHKAWWASRSIQPDRWNKTFFTQATVEPSTYWYPIASPRSADELVSSAPYVDLPAPTLLLFKDTLIADHRQLNLFCQPAPGTTTIHMSFHADHPADSMSVIRNPSPLESSIPIGHSLSGPFGWLDYDAPPNTGFNLVITCVPHEPFTIDLTARTMGLPAAAGFHGYPDDVIPAPATFANTTMVQRSYTFQ